MVNGNRLYGDTYYRVPYDTDLISAFKKIPGHRWNIETGEWVFPSAYENMVDKTLRDHGIHDIQHHSVVPVMINAASRIPLRDYQIEAVTELITKKRVILGDKMGMGKTSTSLVAAKYLIDHLRAERVLILCPSYLQLQWQAEAAKFLGIYIPIAAQGRARTMQYADFMSISPKHRFMITTYEKAIRPDFPSLVMHERTVLIADEATKVKSSATKAYRVIRGIKSGFKWGLTGTPLQNSPAELYHMSRAMGISSFGAYNDFVGELCVSDGYRLTWHTSMMAAINQLVRSCVLRRTWQDVGMQMPPITDETISVTPSESDRASYNAVLEAYNMMATGLSNPDSVPASVLKQMDVDPDAFSDRYRAYLGKWMMALLVILTEISDTPMLLDHSESKLLDMLISEYGLNLDTENIGGKLTRFAEYVPDIYGDDQTITYTRFAEMAHILQRFIPDSRVFAGGSPDSTITDFVNGRFRNIIMVYGKGGYGLNLQNARIVVQYDSVWNPGVIAQAVTRAYRPGQNSSVAVFKFLVDDVQMIEQRIRETLGIKEEQFEIVFGSGMI